MAICMIHALTLLLEELLLLAGITLLHFPALPVKILAQVLVILGNYIISKLLVFKKPGSR